MLRTPPDFMRMLVLRMLVLAAAVMAVFLLLTSADADQLPGPTTAHVVASGDTLWSLAGSVAPADADLRPVVREIMALNALDHATIHPGQQILLPAG